MAAQIYIRLINFKCFTEFELTLQEGLNFFVGSSGVGKTTVNKAIYFCLYGGRKFKNIQNRDSKDKPTLVLIHYQSPNFEWRITRTRPSESVQVEIRDTNGFFIHKDAAAQDWINRQFGVENIWLSASYIGVTKPHFLISGTTNADKLELLQRIAYGDSAPQNQPDTYLTVVKAAILSHNERFKQLNDNIRVSEGIKQSYQTKNPQLVSHPYITEEECWKLISQRDNEKLEMERLRGIYTSLQSKKQFKLHLDSLTKYNESIEDVNKRIETIKIQARKINLIRQLVDFDNRIYDIDLNILSSDHYLYNRYINEGWDKTNIEKFINDNKENLKEYEEQLQIVKKNKDITASNDRKIEINNSLTANFNKLNLEYNRLMKEYDEYNKKSEEISRLKQSLGEYKYMKISEEDDMSSTFIYSIVKQTSEIIEKYKLLIKEGEIYNSHKKLVEDKKQNLIVPSKLVEEDDLSIKFINEFMSNLSKNIDNYKNKIKDSERYIEIKKIIDKKKLNLINPIKVDENDDLSSKYFNNYLINLSNQLDELLKSEELLKKRKELLVSLNESIEEMNSIKCDKITNNDTLSYTYAQEYRITLIVQLNELTCPHCNHGLLLDNGNLHLGTSKNNSIESKEERLSKIKTVEDEILKRSSRDILDLKICEYNKAINDIQDGDLEEIKRKIYNINEIKYKTQYEYQIRNIFETEFKEISEYGLELSNLTMSNIEELNCIISKYRIILESYSNETYMRNTYINNLNEIAKLEYDLSKMTEYPIKEYQLEIKNNNDKLILAKIELEKRMKYDDNNNIISSFEKIIPFNIPTKPIEPELLKIDELIPLKNKVKPTLEIFDVPFHSYDDYLRLWNSNSIKELDKELKSIIVDDYKGNNIEKDINDNIILESAMKKIHEERLRYETIIASLPEDDSEIENKITYLYNSINFLDAKINLANEMKEIKRIDNSIIQMTSDLNNTIDYLGHLNYYYSTTEELGMIALEQRINDINTPLKEILDSLFDEPISVKISPFKEMKNGNTKLQVNLVVEHKNALVDDYDDECSTGQIGRISIALLLAFARNNSNPFIIIDEVLSSVEPTRQTDILDILPSYSSGKFIINICHGVAEGNANNVIYFK